MTLTLIGIVQCLIGFVILLRGGLRAAFAFLLISLLFGGSAAITLPALGGSTIPPAQFALLFVFLHIVVPRGGHTGSIPPAISANIALVLFAVYGVVSAIAAPRIFAGEMDVAPLRFGTRSLFDTVPLGPTSQNITAMVYLVGTLVTAIAAYIACRDSNGSRTLVKTGVAIAWIHVATGLIAAFAAIPIVETTFEILRNGNYAQLNQSYRNFARINGLFPEASAWAAFGFAWFVFLAECWYRSIDSRATGLAAAVLGLVLFFSTSSTAYLGLGSYCLFVLFRLIAFPKAVSGKQLVQIAAVVFALVFFTAVSLALSPEMVAEVTRMLDHMLLNKADSDSGRQRLFWAAQGWDGFFVSYGIGIGMGSFRSSSLISAIFGSTGVIGTLAFAIYLWRVLDPLRFSTWSDSPSPELSIGGAAAIAAIVGLVPAFVSAPSADPGMAFGVFAGCALALRRRGYARVQQEPPEFTPSVEGLRTPPGSAAMHR